MKTMANNSDHTQEFNGINWVRKIREGKMWSKAELARKAGVTVQTIDRIEKGNDCRMDTKRKIILALGFDLSSRSRVFCDENGSEH